MNSRDGIYQIISAAFCVLVVISNVLSAKMILIPFFHLSIPAGLLAYPFTFLLSDLVTEVYGSKQARWMVYTAFSMCLFSLVLTYVTLLLPTESLRMQIAFHDVFGFNGVRVLASLIAYIVSQMIDIRLYSWIKSKTGTSFLWLRNNGSTCVSQLIDTLLIDIIFLYGGLKMDLAQIYPIMLFSYLYKAFFSLACTPLFYLSVSWVSKRLSISVNKHKDFYV